jgi:hypothetical protein
MLSQIQVNNQAVEFHWIFFPLLGRNTFMKNCICPSGLERERRNFRKKNSIYEEIPIFGFFKDRIHRVTTVEATVTDPLDSCETIFVV